jgi:tRNA (cytidine/uridine-2'-O-)-methyltransferase
LTKHARQSYEKINCSGNLFLFFGKETEGLPDDLLRKYEDLCYRIPIKRGARSLNLSNAVAVVVYETLRRTGFSF